ncbi:unnamed protein product [Bathycoccus prasinos]
MTTMDDNNVRMRVRSEEVQCVQPAKKRYSGHKITEILLAKGREREIFFLSKTVNECKGETATNN